MSEETTTADVSPTEGVRKPAENAHGPLTREFEAEPRYTTRKVDEDTWEVGVVLPGVKRDDIDISLEEKELEITASRESGVPDGWRPLHLGRRVPNRYRLELTLNLDVDPDRISAKLEDGILSLRLPVAEAARPRRISVS